MSHEDAALLQVEVLEFRESDLLPTQARRREKRHEKSSDVARPSLDGFRRKPESFHLRVVEYAHGLRYRSRESDVLVLPEVRYSRVSVTRGEPDDVYEELCM